MINLAQLASPALGLLLCGCTTLYTESEHARQRTTGEVQNLRDQLAILKERVVATEAAQQDLDHRTERARSADAAEIRQLKDRLSELEKRLAALDAARASDREQIVTTLSGRISEAVKSQTGPSRGARVERGYEHVVQAGQSLSEIAAAYKVSVSAIVEANRLRNPNAIRVGQKLFIPAE